VLFVIDQTMKPFLPTSRFFSVHTRIMMSRICHGSRLAEREQGVATAWRDIISNY
jgi:hypothetical protein